MTVEKRTIYDLIREEDLVSRHPHSTCRNCCRKNGAICDPCRLIEAFKLIGKRTTKSVARYHL